MVDSDLIKFLGENIGRLEPFDYFLILLISILISLGVYFIIRSIYRQVIAAHEKLISIQDKTIEHHEKNLSLLATQRDELQNAHFRVEQELEKIRTALQSQNEQHNEKVNDLIKRVGGLVSLITFANIGFLQLHILHIYYVRAAQLAPYTRFVRNAQLRSPNDIANAIDELMEKLFDLLKIINIGVTTGNAIKWPDPMSQKTFELLTRDSELDRARLAIRDDLQKIEPVISEQMQTLLTKIQSKPVITSESASKPSRSLPAC